MTSVLPTHPSLENLKNQAKTLLSRFKKGDAGVCGVFRHLRRFAGATDEKLLAADVTLAEVQFALAIEYGFADWKALKAHVESIRPDSKAPGDDLIEAQAGQPGAKTVAAILAEGAEAGASDTHLEWTHGRLAARHRISGVLRPSKVDIPEAEQPAVIDQVKALGAMDTQRHDIPQMGRCTWKLGARKLDMRISVVPYVSGESVVVRYLAPNASPVPLEKQGLTDENLRRLRQWVASPNGVILVTGPAGCGKTTTLYSLLRELRSDELKIVTAEDPVEITYAGMQQQQIDPSRGITYAQAVRLLMRQDPDVIMVGECADQETLEQILTAALTGHLVLTTMHTNDACSALSRMLDMHAQPCVVASSIIGVLAQRLVRMICPDCKEQYEPPQWLRDSAPEFPSGSLFRGAGCQKCHNTGYQGRTAIHELLEADGRIRELVARAATAADIRQAALASGMVALWADGMAKVAAGITTIDDVLAVTR